ETPIGRSFARLAWSVLRRHTRRTGGTAISTTTVAGDRSSTRPVLLHTTTQATRLDMASLAARQAGNDGGKGLHVPLKEHVGGKPPAFPAQLEVFHDLLHGPQEDVGGLEDVGGAQLRPPVRQLLGGDVTMVRHFHPLH